MSTTYFANALPSPITLQQSWLYFSKNHYCYKSHSEQRENLYLLHIKVNVHSSRGYMVVRAHLFMKCIASKVKERGLKEKYLSMYKHIVLKIASEELWVVQVFFM